MANWHELKEGAENMLHSVTEGWRQIIDRASGALTRYLPGLNREGKDDGEAREIARRSSGWGMLAAEVSETDKKVVVRLEAPGLEADEIDIQVIDNTLIVRGEKRLQREHTDGRYHIMECAYGHFERAIPLPARIAADRAEASYRKGVLRIELPKSDQPTGKVIRVR
ncbi:heat shock protein Hsp20 [Geothermobacter ehrlichii]|uniref:Heat shock protein Hsp20 n=1 Tax=Geothermobacter ehrlichii TaxID=213224 RepID=A0A5D3WMD2_9BACT|nr:Hsp20/alpha crystallin family protein [Geothermobacter ehrlichii]TYO99649.1 heat shock protein Hsp20 [Geothermobacter ehrlichii]